MTIIESTIKNAITWNLKRYGEANIIIAGAIGSGIDNLAQGIQTWLKEAEQTDSKLLDQMKFLKPIDKLKVTEYGYIIDEQEAYYMQRFIGFAKVIAKNNKINFFVGPHAIIALDDKIPHATTFYVETSFVETINRRLEDEKLKRYAFITGDNSYMTYSHFVHLQYKWGVHSQRFMADIVLKSM